MKSLNITWLTAMLKNWPRNCVSMGIQLSLWLKREYTRFIPVRDAQKKLTNSSEKKEVTGMPENNSGGTGNFRLTSKGKKRLKRADILQGEALDNINECWKHIADVHDGGSQNVQSMKLKAILTAVVMQSKVCPAIALTALFATFK